VAGQGSDVIVVQASDGVLSSNYQTLTVSPYDANPPVITASSMMLNPGQTSISAENLLPAYDPDGTAIMTYHVSDVTGNGYFEVDGVAQAANTILQLTAAQFAETTYVSGPGLDQIIVQASDGVLWSNWKSITVSGYDAAAPVVNVTPVTETTGKSVAASSLFSAVAADGGQISTYHLEELSGTGHFVVDGVAEAAGSTLTVTAAQLAQTTYQAGLGTDQIMVQASDGVLWSNWNQVSVTGVSSANFSVSDTLEISSPFSKTVTFADSTSTLKIDHASDFTGTIGGQLSSGNVIDLADVSLGPNETVAFSGNNSSGVLTVSDGTHTATIGLAGTYSASGFVASSDGQGGTAIVYSPPATPTVLDGSQGNQVLTATAGPTTLIGGQNDVLNAGTGTDTFVFHAGSGTNIVNGFTSGQDIIQLDQAAFANAEAVLAHVQQVGADAQIVINPQDVVTLHNVQVTSLHAADFHLV
jgi:hypothetical protein